MKNRAKCRLCESIIESMHTHDYVECKCGEIAVDGGNDYMRCVFRNFENFLRVDDEGNIIIPTLKDPEPKEENKSVNQIKEKWPEELESEETKRKRIRLELIEAVDQMVKATESLPQEAMMTAITHYDYLSVLLLLSSILKLGDE